MTMYKRPCKITNTMRVHNQEKNVMLLCAKWRPRKATIDDIRKQVLEKVHEKLSR